MASRTERRWLVRVRAAQNSSSLASKPGPRRCGRSPASPRVRTALPPDLSRGRPGLSRDETVRTRALDKHALVEGGGLAFESAGPRRWDSSPRLLILAPRCPSNSETEGRLGSGSMSRRWSPSPAPQRPPAQGCAAVPDAPKNTSRGTPRPPSHSISTMMQAAPWSIGHPPPYLGLAWSRANHRASARFGRMGQTGRAFVVMNARAGPWSPVVFVTLVLAQHRSRCAHVLRRQRASRTKSFATRPAQAQGPGAPERPTRTSSSSGQPLQ